MKVTDAINQHPKAHLIPELIKHRDGRIAISRNDPLLFAEIYLPHYLESDSTPGQKTLSEFHLALIEYGKTWIGTHTGGSKTAFIAPRKSGKSTWISNILVLWAAAHGHQQFIALFGAAYKSICDKISDFKTEVETNKLLQSDFPDLCTPYKGPIGGRPPMYSSDSVRMTNGFIMTAHGADSNVLGMKQGSLRPTLILCDDIEGGESNYSNEEVRKRLITLTDDIFPLNDQAQVAIVGTTTRLGSIMDQIRSVADMQQQHHGTFEEFVNELPDDLKWVAINRIGCYYFPAIIDINTDTERSYWPEEKPLEAWALERTTASFAKNYMCRPVSANDAYWSDNDIHVDQCAEYGNTIISIDPAVTTNKKSDYTGIAVISRGADIDKQKNIYVRYAGQHKLSPEALVQYVTDLIHEYNAKVVIVESNMGGDLLGSLFKDVPAKVNQYRSKENKNVRAQAAFHWYEKQQVFHTHSMPEVEKQMKAFPQSLHDDMVDAISAGVNYFLNNKSRPAPSAYVYKYA